MLSQKKNQNGIYFKRILNCFCSILPTFPNYFTLRNPVTSFLVYTTRIYILTSNTPSQMKTLFLVPTACSMAAEKIRNVYPLDAS